MKIATAFLEWAEHRLLTIGQARLWAALRTMDASLLRKAGLEPELLDLGPHAWPWRAGAQDALPSIDRPIDQRGTPVAIESTDRLPQIERDSGSHPLDSEVRHKAA